jgi:hypothetical protein
MGEDVAMADLALSELTGEKPPFVAGTFFDLAGVGYEQAEYAIAGTARAYGRAGAGLEVVEEAPFRTRIVIYRPADAARFDGTVVVEWLNVSAGLDAAPVWQFTHRELLRSGSVWIGVSAQAVGVEGGPATLSIASSALKDIDPERYGSLRHPGDRFSYDIFTQVAAVARGEVPSILDGLPVARVLGAGESQSAFRLSTYVNDIDPVAPVYDGFFVHARGGTAAPLDDGHDPRRLREGPPVPFADDLRVPVLCVEAETDLVVLGYAAARREDGPHLVVWEVAGCSHADVYTFAVGFADDGRQPHEQLAAGWVPSRDLLGQTLEHPVNAGPQHWVLQAAVRALQTWVGDGVRPPASPRLELDGERFATDALGNARGGIRTPHVDVPTGVLSGLGNSGGPLAFLSGCTRPFDHERLVELYGTKAEFVARFRAATLDAVAAGFLLADDVEEIVAIAEHNVDL